METAIREYIPESNELDAPLTVEDIKAQVDLIQQVMRSVMKEDTHFGVIPGCGDKPTLYKAGAEKILTTFRIAVKPLIENLSTEDEIRYRIICQAYTPSDKFLGSGVGECSSNEERYKWRKAVCDEEFNETLEDRRREKWCRANNGNTWKVKQVRTQPADLANTILKIAKKRAMVDMTLTVTAASDIFTQDIEDMDSEHGIGSNNRSETNKRSNNPPQRSANDNIFPVVDRVERIASKALPDGRMRYGIKLIHYGWFTSFEEKDLKTAELASVENMKVKIFYVKIGEFRNISSLVLEEINEPIY